MQSALCPRVVDGFRLVEFDRSSQVRLGRRYGDSIEVLAGLVEGESVAVDPVSAGIFLKEQPEQQ